MDLTVEGRCWRQIHPVHLQDDFCKLEAFIPTPKDERQLSVGHSSKASAVECFDSYRCDLGLSSAGVAQFRAATISQAAEAVGVTTALVDDSAMPDRPAWHCYVDFTQIAERAKRKALAQQLWHAARTEGWAHQAPASESIPTPAA
jgi:hypothetical protein